MSPPWWLIASSLVACCLLPVVAYCLLAGGLLSPPCWLIASSLMACCLLPCGLLPPPKWRVASSVVACCLLPGGCPLLEVGRAETHSGIPRLTAPSISLLQAASAVYRRSHRSSRAVAVSGTGAAGPRMRPHHRPQRHPILRSAGGHGEGPSSRRQYQVQHSCSTPARHTREFVTSASSTQP